VFASGSVDLEVAVIGAIAVIGAAAVPAWLNSRKVKNAIGTPNGNGNLVQMLETSLENQGIVKEHVAKMATQLELVSAVQEQHALDDAQHQLRTDKRFEVVFHHLGIPPEESDVQS